MALAIAVLAGCSDAPQLPESEAVLIAVLRAQEAKPESSALRILPHWRGGNSTDSLPPQLLGLLTDATGISVASARELSSRDPELALLSVSRPMLSAGDTIWVEAGWNRLGNGDGGGGWGVEYRLGLLCAPGCRIARDLGPDEWN